MHDYEQIIANLTPASPKVSVIHEYNFPGQKALISWKATGIFDENGTLVEILNVGRDISEYLVVEKKNDELLGTLNAYKRAIDANIICTITDAKGGITYANENFCKISGYPLSEILGNTHRIVNSGFHSRDFFTELWRTIRSGKVWTGEIKNRAKDGSFYWVNSVIIPITDNKNIISGFLSLRVPITEQKKIEEERLDYFNSLERMLFMVSHEIRRPITSCQGLLNLLQTNMPATKEEYDEIISYMLSSASELDSFSRELSKQISININSINH